jgi:D-glycero-alpha-D-manno-heptose-7-phosphate kinase
MIISRTPLRISFAGGGSDLASFYSRAKGAVVSTSIDKHIYITANRKFDGRIRASYSITEMVGSVDELRHDLIREALRLVGIPGGIELTSISDIPSRGTGLGSSSCYTVGLLNAMHAYKGEYASRERLAQEACKVEIEMCGSPVGKQDQYAAAHGGLNHIEFHADGRVTVEPVICSPETRAELQRNLLLLYTGLVRSSAPILEEQNAALQGDEESFMVTQQMARYATEMRDALSNNDLQAFGEILHANWVAKKQLSPLISSPTIDEWYDTGRKVGAIGGKILGAGGGGFLLLYAPQEVHGEITRSLPGLRPVNFAFETQGSAIVFYDAR